MTLVILKFAVPEAAGQQPSAGALRWTPTKRRTAGDWVVMPAGFTVPLVNGEATVEVAPTGADWVWRVDEHVPTTQGGSRYVAVPDLAEIDYTDLIAVDPKTLEPSADPDPAWYAYVDTLEGQAATASASAVSAKNAAEAAQLSATGSETSAAASAATATTKAAEASTSATNAAGSAASALTYKNDAADSADLAGRTGLTIGTVTTVGFLEDAEATITGENPNRLLNLSIPHGPANVLEIGTVETVPGTPLDDEIVAEQVLNGVETKAALNATYARVIQVISDGSADQAARINTALTTAAPQGTRKTIKLVGDFTIGAALRIPANTTLDAYDATITAKAGWAGYMVQAFGQATSTRTAGIRIFGGTWHGNGTNRTTNGTWTDPATWVGHSFDLQKVDDTIIRDVKMTGALKWAIAVADFTQLITENLTFDTTSDGIHVLGPGTTWRCNGVYGKVGDDLVAVSTVEWPAYAVSEGNVTDVKIRDVHAVNAFSVMRMLGGTNTYMQDILLENVTGTLDPVYSSTAAIYCNDDQNSVGRAGTDCRNLVIRNVKVNTNNKPVVVLGAANIDKAVLENIHGLSTDANAHLLQTSAGVIKDLRLRGLHRGGGGSGTGVFLNAGTFTSVSIDGMHYESTLTSNIGIYVGTTASITNLRCKDLTLIQTGSGGDVLRVDGTVGYATINGVRMVNGGAVASQNLTTTNAPVWDITDVDADGVGSIFKAKAAFEVTVANVRFVNPGVGVVSCYGASATGRIHASGWKTTAPGLTRDATQVIRSSSTGVRCDLARLTRTVGDLAYNTNAGLSCGVGPVVSDGTTWKHLHTGATY